MALDDHELEATVRRIYQTPSLLSPQVIPGGTHATFKANIDETYQAYLWEIGKEGYRRLTNEHDPVGQAIPDRAGKRLAILRDEGGTELYRLSLIDLDHPEAGEKLVTPEPLGRVHAVGWAADGQRLVLSGNDDSDNFVAVFDLPSQAMKKLFTSDRWLESSDLSEDGRWVATSVARHENDPEDHDIAVFALDAPEDIRWVSTGEGDRDENPLWSPDASLLAFTAEIDDSTNLVVYQSDDLSEVARLKLDGDVVALAYWSPANSWLDLILERHGVDSLMRAHLKDGRVELDLAPGAPRGSVASARREGDLIALASSSMDQPMTSMKVVDLEGDEVAALEIAALNLPLQAASSEWIESADGANIQAWVIRPEEDAGVARPGIVYVHGGPTWASKDSWRRDIPSLVLEGYTVIAPNFRGSTGFGPEFRKANILDLGGKDLEDCLAAAAWLRRQPEVDPGRIAITGGSYGGYMVLQAMTTAPEVFACGAGTIPVADWVQDYELADASFRYYDVYFFGGTPEEKPDLYRERSPITHVQNLKAPMFISAGRNDSRCPFPPIEHFVEKALELGKEIEFDVQESEGHGATRKTAAIETELKILRFLRRHLSK